MKNNTTKNLCRSLIVLLCATGTAVGAEEKSLSLGITADIDTSSSVTGGTSTTSGPLVSEAVATVEAKISRLLAGNVAFKYEDGAGTIVDEAFATYAVRTNATVSGGRLYVPFGNYESAMISDSLTKKLGETRAHAINWEQKNDGYVLNGFAGVDSSYSNTPLFYGLKLAKETVSGKGLSIEASFTSDLSVSGNIRGALSTPADPVSRPQAIALRLGSTDKQVGWAAEYLAAIGSFNSADLAFNGKAARPVAYQLEFNLTSKIGAKDVTYALGYQGTDEALALGLPSTRTLLGASTSLAKHVGIGFEWARDRDYAVSVGGTGAITNTYTLQVSLQY